MSESSLTAPVEITVVESAGCHFCADAHQVLTSLSARYPIEVASLDVDTDEGRQLMARHRAAMSPLVLVDGVFFSNGRLPRRKLDKILDKRFGRPAATSLVG